MSKEQDVLRRSRSGQETVVSSGCGVSDSFRRNRVKGRVTFIEHDDEGRILSSSEEANLVVDGAYDLISLWCSGASDDSFAAIAVGDGGHVPGDPNTPIPPSETDTSLDSEIARKNISVKENPDPSKVKFTTVFLTTEGNGSLTEAGLFTVNGVMFARVTFPVKVKSGTNMIVRWEITF